MSRNTRQSRLTVWIMIHNMIHEVFRLFPYIFLTSVSAPGVFKIKFAIWSLWFWRIDEDKRTKFPFTGRVCLCPCCSSHRWQSFLRASDGRQTQSVVFDHINLMHVQIHHLKVEVSRNRSSFRPCALLCVLLFGWFSVWFSDKVTGWALGALCVVWCVNNKAKA